MKSQVIIQIRFVAFLCLLGSILLLSRNLFLSYENFNPSYLGHYFKQELLSPMILFLGGVLTYLLSGKIAGLLTKGID